MIIIYPWYYVYGQMNRLYTWARGQNRHCAVGQRVSDQKSYGYLKITSDGNKRFDVLYLCTYDATFSLSDCIQIPIFGAVIAT